MLRGLMRFISLVRFNVEFPRPSMILKFTYKNIKRYIKSAESDGIFLYRYPERSQTENAEILNFETEIV